MISIHGGTGAEVQPFGLPEWLVGGEGSGEIFEQARRQRRRADEDLQKMAGSNVYPYQDVAVQQTVEFAHIFPVSSQVLNFQALLDGDAGEKVQAAASLILDFTTLLSIASKASEIGAGIRTAEKSAMKKTGKAVEVVETSARKAGRTVREVASEIASDVGKKVNNIEWPPHYGFKDGKAELSRLKKGVKIDRYGGQEGARFVSPDGMPFPQRALPDYYQHGEYHRYEVIKEMPVFEGKIAPWFGQPGEGTQYYLPDELQNLVRDGYLRELLK